MAHFAKVVDGVVEKVTVVSNDVMLDGEGAEQESLGQAFLNSQFGEATWIQCSYNDNIRGHFPGVGALYDSVNDVFYEPQPFPSWTLNTTTFDWEPPIAFPNTAEKTYELDEENKSWKEIT